METFWTIASIVSLVGTALLFVAVVALAREIGQLLLRFGPPLAKPTDQGPELGTNLFLSDSDFMAPVRATMRSDRPAMLLLTTSHCEQCLSLLRNIDAFARDYRDLDIVILHDGDTSVIRVPQKNMSVISSDHQYAKEQLHIHAFPFALFVSSVGVLLARGIVSTIPQLESLIRIEYVQHSASSSRSASTAAGGDGSSQAPALQHRG